MDSLALQVQQGQLNASTEPPLARELQPSYPHTPCLLVLTPSWCGCCQHLSCNRQQRTSMGHASYTENVAGCGAVACVEVFVLRIVFAECIVHERVVLMLLHCERLSSCKHVCVLVGVQLGLFTYATHSHAMRDDTTWHTRCSIITTPAQNKARYKG